MKSIYLAAARLNNKAAMRTLLEPIPNANGLRSILKAGQSGRTQSYHEETRKAFYVACDGREVWVWTITDVTLDQAARVAAACDDRVWSSDSFQDAVRRALGEEVVRAQ